MARTIKILKKEKNLSCVGFGGFGAEKIKISSLSFEREGDPLNIDQARKLLIFAAETYLNQFNSEEKIKPYLINVPFTYKNIQIEIFLHDHNNDTATYPHIACVSLSRSSVFYYDNRNSKRFTTALEEPYEKALEIVNKQTDK